MNTMKKMFFLIFFAFTCIAISFGFFKGSKVNITNKGRFDTIRYAASMDMVADGKYAFLNSYRKRFGIVISNYYVVQDSLPINLDNDNDIDTVIVLSPMSLEPIETHCSYEFDKSPKRLLIEIIVEKGESKVRGIFPNLISDAGGVLSHYNGIFKTKKGFKIVHEAGAKYSWYYSVELSTGKEQLRLVNISKVCSFEGKKKEIEYAYNNISLENLNVPDTLRNRCNCDIQWSLLEQK